MATKNITVDMMINTLQNLKAQGEIKGGDQIWLASDGEGNNFSPLVFFKDGSLNAGKEKGKLILYPCD